VAVVEEGGTVRLMHRIVPGGADRSYGIHVAKLAGLPREVLVRAQGVLDRLEESARATSQKGLADKQGADYQLALFERDSGLADEIAGLPLDSMTPLEAISVLYSLRERARKSGEGS